VPLTRAVKEERAARELTNVQHIARKEQALAEDRRKQIGVLARTH
jgi:hypothetical protein